MFQPVYLLLDHYGVRFVDWNFNFVRNFLLDGVRNLDFLVDWVGLGNLDRVRPVNWNFHFVRNLFQDMVRLGHFDGFLYLWKEVLG